MSSETAQEIIDEVGILIVQGRHDYFPPDFTACFQDKNSSDIAIAISKCDNFLEGHNGEPLTLKIREALKEELKRRENKNDGKADKKWWEFWK